MDLCARMDPTKMAVNDCVTVQLKTQSDPVTGVVFSLDDHFLVLRTPNSTTVKKASYTYIPIASLDKVTSEESANEPLKPVSRVAPAVMDSRLHKNGERHSRAVKHKGRNVTENEQKLFDKLVPGWPTAEWGEDGAITFPFGGSSDPSSAPARLILNRPHGVEQIQEWISTSIPASEQQTTKLKLDEIAKPRLRQLLLKARAELFGEGSVGSPTA